MAATPARSRSLVAACFVAAIAIVGVFLFFNASPRQPAQGAESSVSVARGPEAAKASEPVEIIVTRPGFETNVPEMKYLPTKIEIAESSANPLLSELGIRDGHRRVTQVRRLTNPELHGHFISPRLSPDGLQVLLTRPGYNGVYVMALSGGAAVLVAEENAYRARWTREGKIEVIGADGTRRVYGADGTLEESALYDPKSERVYYSDDTIFARAEAGGTAVPITGTDDRYMSPVISPDGTQVAYLGAYSGIYVAPLDGSSKPRFLGEGNNFIWSPNSDGLIYDITRDDGHNLTEGDIYHLDLRSSERSNLTEGDNLISQVPSLGPDGRSLAFEADGGIYIGTLQ